MISLLAFLLLNNIIISDPIKASVRDAVFFDIPETVTKVVCKPENTDWKLAVSFDTKKPFVMFFPKNQGTYIFGYNAGADMDLIQVDVGPKPDIPGPKPDIPGPKPDTPSPGPNDELTQAIKGWLAKVPNRTGQAQLSQAYEKTANDMSSLASAAIATKKPIPTVQDFLTASKANTAALMGASRENWREFDAAFAAWRKNRPLTLSNYIKWWLTASAALKE